MKKQIERKIEKSYAGNDPVGQFGLPGVVWLAPALRVDGDQVDELPVAAENPDLPENFYSRWLFEA